MARPSALARSPRARVSRGARAAPRGEGAGRRSARASFGNELEAAGDVAHLPARRVDLAAEPVGLVEVLARPRGLPLFSQRDQLRWRRGRLGKPAETEQRQSPAKRRQSAARAPFVEES